MGKKVVLILQGGGALGAFQCGAWTALSPFLRANEHELVAVAGASIGAINAALIARHYADADLGSKALQEFWWNTVARPSAVFFPLPGKYWRAWNGLLTSLLLGNRALFSPAYHHWNPIGELFRFHLPLYETYRAECTLEQCFGEYRGNAPLLAVGVTDVKSGKAALFDSASQCITPRMLLASAAIPMFFPAIEIDGRYYWDAEMRSNTLLPEVFALLRDMQPRTGRSEAPEEFLFIIVDMFGGEAERPPASGLQAQYRLLNILLGDKLKYDEAAFESGNAYLASMQRLRQAAAGAQHASLAAAIEEEYRKARALQPGPVEILHIGREPLEYDYISRDLDYSPSRIASLFVQGFDSASATVMRYQQGSMHAEEAGGAQIIDHPSRKRDRRGPSYPRLV